MKARRVFLICLMFVTATLAAAAAPKIESDKDTSGLGLLQNRTTIVTEPNSIKHSSLSSRVGATKPGVNGTEGAAAELKTAANSPLAGEQIKWQVVSGGGNRSVSTSFVLSATVGQVATGLISSANYKVNQGYWQDFDANSGGCCTANSIDGRTGNVDADPGRGVDISDLTILIDFLYVSFNPPVCMPSANIDGDAGGGIDISDLSRLIDYLYINFTLPEVCQ